MSQTQVIERHVDPRHLAQPDSKPQTALRKTSHILILMSSLSGIPELFSKPMEYVAPGDKGKVRASTLGLTAGCVAAETVGNHGLVHPDQMRASIHVPSVDNREIDTHVSVENALILLGAALALVWQRITGALSDPKTETQEQIASRSDHNDAHPTHQQI